jgi:hypothetical protein
MVTLDDGTTRKATIREIEDNAETYSNARWADTTKDARRSAKADLRTMKRQYASARRAVQKLRGPGICW